VREALARLVAHLRWADERVQAALGSSDAPPEAALRAYAHTVAAERLWLDRIAGVAATVAVWPTLSLDDLSALAEACHGDLDVLVSRAGEADLEQEVAYTNTAGQSFRTALGDILLHVCLHGMHHRGQVSLLLRQGGLDPVPTDYIAFARGTPAAMTPVPGRLEAIWIKRVHRGPMDPVEAAQFNAGRGIEGNADQGGKRQVTLLEREAWDAMMREVGSDVSPGSRRANLLVSGVQLRETRGRVLRIGGCRVRVWGETRPCDHMDDAAQGLRTAMGRDWRGGVFGEILDDGQVRVGDPVTWVAGTP